MCKIDTLQVDSIPQQCKACEDAIANLSAFTWFDWFSLVASAVTIIGFILTLWQVWGVRESLNQVESKIKDAILKERERAGNNEQKEVIQSIIDKITDVFSSLSNNEYKAAYASMCSIKSCLSRYKAFGHQLEGLDDAESPIIADMSSVKDINLLQRWFNKPDFTFIIEDMTKLNTLLTKELKRLNNE